MVVDRRETIQVEEGQADAVSVPFCEDGVPMCDDADSLDGVCLARLLALQLGQH